MVVSRRNLGSKRAEVGRGFLFFLLYLRPSFFLMGAGGLGFRGFWVTGYRLGGGLEWRRKGALWEVSGLGFRPGPGLCCSGFDGGARALSFQVLLGGFVVHFVEASGGFSSSLGTLGHEGLRVLKFLSPCPSLSSHNKSEPKTWAAFGSQNTTKAAAH